MYNHPLGLLLKEFVGASDHKGRNQHDGYLMPDQTGIRLPFKLLGISNREMYLFIKNNVYLGRVKCHRQTTLHFDWKNDQGLSYMITVQGILTPACQRKYYLFIPELFEFNGQLNATWEMDCIAHQWVTTPDSPESSNRPIIMNN